MTLEMKLAEERKEGYEEGAAAQRAKDEAELKILKDKQVSDEAEIAQLKAEIERMRNGKR